MFSQQSRSRAKEMLDMLQEIDQLPEDTEPLKKDLQEFIMLGEAGDGFLMFVHEELKDVLDLYKKKQRQGAPVIISARIE